MAPSYAFCNRSEEKVIMLKAFLKTKIKLQKLKLADLLAKTKGLVLFPKLGVPRLPQEVPYRTGEQITTSMKLLGDKGSRGLPQEKKQKIREDLVNWSQATRGAVVGLRNPGKEPYGERTIHGGVKIGVGDLGTKVHENQHSVFHNIGEQYGYKHRSLLANYLIDSLPDRDKKAFLEYTSHRAGVNNADPWLQAEERITGLHTYLNSPRDREAGKKYFAEKGVDEKGFRTIDKNIKRWMRHFQQVSKQVTPKHLENYHGIVADTARAKTTHLQPQTTAEIKKTADTLVSVYIIRHGRTKYNAGGEVEDRIRGWLNISLTEEGQQEAAKTGEMLLNRGIKIIHTSNLDRAVDTSQIVADKIGAPIVSREQAFRPWNLGDLQGQITSKILDKIHDLIRNPDKEAPKGESFNEFLGRYLTRLKAVMGQAINDKQNVAIAAHYRNLEVAKEWYNGGMKDIEVNFKDLTSGKDIPTGGMLVFDWNGQKWTMREEKSSDGSDSGLKTELKKIIFETDPDKASKLLPFHGWINPEGKFHQLSKLEGHNQAAEKKHGKHMFETSHDWHKKGWVALGHAVGGNIASMKGHKDILHDSSHPATKEVAYRVKQLPKEYKHIEVELPTNESSKHNEFYKVPRELAEKGNFKQPSVVTAFRYEASIKEKLEMLKNLLKYDNSVTDIVPLGPMKEEVALRQEKKTKAIKRNLQTRTNVRYPEWLKKLNKINELLKRLENSGTIENKT